MGDPELQISVRSERMGPLWGVSEGDLFRFSNGPMGRDLDQDETTEWLAEGARLANATTDPHHAPSPCSSFRPGIDR